MSVKAIGNTKFRNIIPTDILNCQLWLDSSDSSTITLDGSNNVSQWNDKSGNDYHATQVSPSFRPEYSLNAYNNKPGIIFNGTSEWFADHSVAPIGENPYTLFLVCRPDSNISPQDDSIISFQDISFSTNQGKWEIRIDGILKYYDSSEHAIDSNSWLDTQFVLSAIANNSSIDGYINGTQGNLMPTAISSLPTNQVYFSIGQEFDGITTPSNWFKGIIFEIILFNKILINNQRESMENYLSNKWGISI